MRRVISVWLPRWPIDRLRRARARARSRPRAGPAHWAAAETAEAAEAAKAAAPSARVPFALVAPGRRGPVLWAVNREAGAEGLRPGMRLADARALHTGLVTARADPAADRQGLERLALWCNRFTPWCAVDGEDGLLLDITGCAHLFGGEAALMDEIAARVIGLGVESRLGLADTPGAAWALARFGPAETRIAAPGGAHTAIAGLPVEALRLAAEDAHLLRRLGLTTIGAVEGLPRASLARRFPCRERGSAVLARLDRALGRQAEPIVPMAPPPACLERLALLEPLIDRAGLDAALARLMPGLAASLERDGLGVRRLVLWCYRVDGGVVRRAVATARATRDGDHLLRLFRETLETVDPGFGIDLAALHAERVEPLAPTQLSLAGDKQRRGDVDLLVDRLLAKLGEGAVCRLEPVARHRPERAEQAVTPGREPVPWSEAPPDAPEAPATPQRPQRPFRLFDRPEPVEVMAEVPDGPPLLFIWRRVRRRVARAAGPERIEPEWWAGAGGRDEAVRDYYRIEDADGRRYWLYRAGLYGDGGGDGGGDAGAGAGAGTGTGDSPRWYVHGLYG